MTKIKRLLDRFAPDHYEVQFDIDEVNLAFTGAVTISGSSTGKSDKITLHAKDLELLRATIDDVDAKISKESPHHEISLSTGGILSPGPHEIHIEFGGRITESMVGIYASSFEHEKAAKRIISTQFESNHAREAFPCIDEPAAKATFQLSLTNSANVEVLSNTPVLEQTETETRLTTRFEKTPKMSSYLLAFALGQLQGVSRTSNSGVAIKAWSAINQPLDYLNYAADEAVKILDFFEDYFGVPYPLKKCDLIALPDFDAGAMENWGMITFREIAMLADPKNRSISSEQYVSMVVAHELSHMWFGNLVTMEWWDDLWLNESFASLMEHVALDSIHPDWHQWEHYAANDILAATSRDIHADIQPVSVEVDDPDLIETLFDPGIVYTKGGRLLKMLMEHIGEDKFRQGLKDYFESNAYSNTTRKDLWTCLGKASGVDVDSLMSSWLDQPGMPLLTIDQAGKQLQLTQSRFVIGSDEESDQTWPIPLLSQPVLEQPILRDSNYRTTLEDTNFVVINSNASGHYISHYMNADHRAFIREGMANGTISSDARINILNDSILLSRKDIIQYDVALDDVLALRGERRYPVWGLIARIASIAQQLTEGNEDAKMHLDCLREHLAQPLINEVGYSDANDSDPNTIQLRSLALSFMLGAENMSALEYAKQCLEEAKEPSNLQSESRSIILSSLIKQGDDELARQLLNDYAGASSEMQLDIVSALSSIRKPKLALEILSGALGPKGIVRPQDVLRWIAIFMRNHHIRNTTWDFMVNNWTWLETTLTNSKSFDYLPTYCAAAVSTDDMADKYRELFMPLRDNKLLKRNIIIGLKDVDSRVRWRQSNQAEVEEWLSNFYASHQNQ